VAANIVLVADGNFTMICCALNERISGRSVDATVTKAGELEVLARWVRKH
jgi:hypothetical protein